MNLVSFLINRLYNVPVYYVILTAYFTCVSGVAAKACYLSFMNV